MSRKAYLIGGGVGSLAAAFFLIRDAGFDGKDIKIFEDLQVTGGSCDGNGSVTEGFLCRGGRMLNAPTYECLHAMLKEIPSIQAPGKSVFQEIEDFNKVMKTHANSRVVDKNGCRLDVDTMGFNMRDRMQLLALNRASEKEVGNSLITDWFSPEFFKTTFWWMWTTTFAFQPWHSALELKRYNSRFLHEFSRIQTLEGVERTPMNQYDSIIAPIIEWLKAKNVQVDFGCCVEDVIMDEQSGKLTAKKISYKKNGKMETVTVGPSDIVFIQNGSMTDASSIGSWKKPAVQKGIEDATSFKVWEKLAARHEQMGNPKSFTKNVTESQWQSFTVTMKNPALFKAFTDYQMNEPGTGALMTFKDSNWFMSIVIAYQPHFVGQNKDTQIMWGYGLCPNKIGNYVNKRMLDCTGEEIFYELCQHCRIAPELVHDVINIPCIMPFITSMFMPRLESDRPLPVPKNSTNFGFISQFVEIPHDVVFTVEFSVRAAQTAVYKLCDVKKKVPKVSRHDHNPVWLLKALKKAFVGGSGTKIEKQNRQKKCCLCKLTKLAAVAGIGAGIAYLIQNK
ncbi:Myosin-cross-reactive_antigen [Hexamita inflata]|uniref:Putative n=1 Tax=Hexamita inflata TaxID=28002 RepID=A0AA86TFL9_9EUKA|nr:Myosin-cross-reactive antigen [Hexamita inflata]CAI9937860.1 Myosin-cross-reactive antigen [Hexamita inflata]